MDKENCSCTCECENAEACKENGCECCKDSCCCDSCCCSN